MKSIAFRSFSEQGGYSFQVSFTWYEDHSHPFLGSISHLAGTALYSLAATIGEDVKTGGWGATPILSPWLLLSRLCSNQLFLMVLNGLSPLHSVDVLLGFDRAHLCSPTTLQLPEGRNTAWWFFCTPSVSKLSGGWQCSVSYCPLPDSPQALFQW